MGLDMYLTKKTSIYAQYEHSKITGEVSILKENEPINIKLNRIKSITESVGYWRKANHIHNWFVKNVQNCIDECEETEVTLEQLQELLNICKKVKENNELAQKLLPTRAGFFFGSTEYNKDYFRSIDETIKILESIFDELDEKNYYVEFYYCSSW